MRGFRNVYSISLFPKAAAIFTDLDSLNRSKLNENESFYYSNIMWI